MKNKELKSLFKYISFQHLYKDKKLTCCKSYLAQLETETLLINNKQFLCKLLTKHYPWFYLQCIDTINKRI